MAVWNVSGKKSRAAIDRSPVWPRHTIVALPARSTAGQSEAGSAWATDPPIVPQLRTCGSPMPPERPDDDAEAVRVLVDLAMRRPGADPQVVVGMDDAVEPADRLEVDEDPSLAEPELQQRDQAVAAGEELRLALSLVEDPDCLVEAPRTDILE